MDAGYCNAGASVSQSQFREDKGDDAPRIHEGIGAMATHLDDQIKVGRSFMSPKSGEQVS